MDSLYPDIYLVHYFPLIHRSTPLFWAQNRNALVSVTRQNLFFSFVFALALSQSL